MAIKSRKTATKMSTPPYKPVKVDRKDWGYTSSAGVALISKDYNDGFLFLRLKDPKTMKVFLYPVGGKFFAPSSVYVPFFGTYKGWIYDLKYEDKPQDAPESIFISDEINLGTQTYPIFYYSSKKWYFGFYALRAAPPNSWKKSGGLFRGSIGAS